MISTDLISNEKSTHGTKLYNHATPENQVKQTKWNWNNFNFQQINNLFLQVGRTLVLAQHPYIHTTFKTLQQQQI